MKRAVVPVLVTVVLAGIGGALVYRYGGLNRVPEPASRPSALTPAASAAPSAESDGGAPDDDLNETAALASSAASELPKDAPRAVRFGVILVQYQGAEQAPGTAPPKALALERAKSLLSEATQNFDEAVKKGDRGSTPNAGTMPRGVLEPPLEYALFTLKKGEVGAAPLDTPRGFWIVRRID